MRCSALLTGSSPLEGNPCQMTPVRALDAVGKGIQGKHSAVFCSAEDHFEAPRHHQAGLSLPVLCTSGAHCNYSHQKKSFSRLPAQPQNLDPATQNYQGDSLLQPFMHTELLS